MEDDPLMPNDKSTDAYISYSVKDKLEDLEGIISEGFTQIQTALLGKADKSDTDRLNDKFDHLNVELGRHENRISTLENTIENQKESRANENSKKVLSINSWQMWIALFVGLLAVGAAIASGVIEAHAAHSEVVHIITTGITTKIK